MTNAQIIQGLKETLGIDPEVPMLTYKEWQRNGRQVQKGQHGIKCNLWKHVKGKNTDPDADGETVEGFVRTPATLFFQFQTEVIAK